MLKTLYQKFFSKKVNEVEFVFSPLRPRKLTIRSSVFHFSIPENFSLDMPAEDMIVQVELDNNRELEKNKVINILNRWWDFSVVETRSFNGATRFGLDIICIDDVRGEGVRNLDFLIHQEDYDLHQYYDPINKDFLNRGDLEGEILLPINPIQYKKLKLNNIDWINYMLVGGKAADIYLLPISTRHYIKAGFYFSPADNFSSCKKLRELMLSEVERIVSSFYYEDAPLITDASKS